MIIDWVAFFLDNPFLLNWTSIYMSYIWVMSICVSFLFAYPLMHPFNYMMNRMDNYNFGESEYWWSNKTFSEVYPTYRNYIITWSLRNQIWFLTKTIPWKLDNIGYQINGVLRNIDRFTSKVIIYYLD
jgi:hypothetical protein